MITTISRKDDKDELKKLKADYQKIFNRFSKKYQGYDLKERVYRSLLAKGYRYNDINKVLGGIGDDF